MRKRQDLINGLAVSFLYGRKFYFLMLNAPEGHFPIGRSAHSWMRFLVLPTSFLLGYTPVVMSFRKFLHAHTFRVATGW